MARKVLQYFQNICQTSHKTCFASLFVLRLHELLSWWMLLVLLFFVFFSPLCRSFAFGKTYCTASFTVSKMINGYSLKDRNLHEQQQSL